MIIYATYLLFVLISGLSADGARWRSNFSKGTAGKTRRRYSERKKAFLYPTPTSGSYDEQMEADKIPTSVSIAPAPKPRFSKPLQHLMEILLTTPLIIRWLFIQFMTLTAGGDDKSVLLVLAYFGLAAWNTYGIIDLKMSNAHLIDGSESVWGFGQVLPVVLLGLVVMNVFDAAKGLLCPMFQR
jgi:hypothetical protein